VAEMAMGHEKYTGINNGTNYISMIFPIFAEGAADNVRQKPPMTANVSMAIPKAI